MNALKSFMVGLMLVGCLALTSFSFGFGVSSHQANASDESSQVIESDRVIMHEVIQEEVAVEPALEVTKEILEWIKTIPKVGPIVQTVMEIFNIIVTVFFLLYGFVMAVVKIPMIAATKFGSPETIAKIEKIVNKIKPIADFIGKLLGPNVQKKK